MKTLKYLRTAVLFFGLFTVAGGSMVSGGESKKDSDSLYPNPAGNILVSGIHMEYPGFVSMRSLKLKTDGKASIYFIVDNAFVPAYIMSAAAGSTMDEHFSRLSAGQQLRGLSFRGGGGFIKLSPQTFVGMGADFDYLIIGSPGSQGGLLGGTGSTYTTLACLGLEVAAMQLSIMNLHVMGTAEYQWILNKEQSKNHRMGTELYLTYRIGNLMSLYGSVGYAHFRFTDTSISQGATKNYGGMLGSFGFALKL